MCSGELGRSLKNKKMHHSLGGSGSAGAGGLGYGSAAGTGATGGATDVAVAAAGAEADTAISISQPTHRGFLGALFFGGHL
jgi:hypothetical protein